MRTLTLRGNKSLRDHSGHGSGNVRRGRAATAGRARAQDESDESRTRTPRTSTQAKTLRLQSLYVDDSTAFGSGHYLCEKSPDLNSVVLWPTTQLSGSFHPTAAGQHAIAGVVEKTLGIG
jgi:hypothetical protein